jgi:hypothetical protein
METETANEVFISLTPQEKVVVIRILEDCRMRYIHSNINVDIPYFFWNIHRPIFEGIDPTEFLDITEPKQFAIQAVFHISNYIIKNRRKDNV